MSNLRVWRPSDPNPAKRYLMEYRSLVKRRDALLDELDRLREANQRATSRLTATRLSGTGGHGSFEDGAIRAIDAEGALNAIILQLDVSITERLGVIEQLNDERQKLVLTYRYINGWDWPEIMRVMNYAERQAFSIHGKALSEVCRRMKRVQ
jgi:hypothetical protein